MSPHRHRFGLRAGAVLLAACALPACGSSPKPPPQTAAPGPAAEKGSSAADRKSVAVTVYNQNFGLVREVRRMKLGTGRVELSFADVAEHLQPETVAIRSLSSASSLQVLEQNYRYDLLSPNNLLDKYVGEKIKVYRYNEKLGREEQVDAEILAFNDGQPVLKVDGEVTYGMPGRFAFPKVPENLIPEPTLVWLLKSQQPEQDVEVSYLTSNMSWKSDYVLVVNEDDTKGDMTGWVTLDNQSGTTFENAKLKLVAGDVQKLAAPPMSMPMQTLAAADAAESEEQFREEGFFEYHLYTLQRPTTLQEKETKQVTLLEAQDAGVEKKLIFRGQQYWFRGRHGQVMSNQKVSVFLDLKNSKKNGLGMPLPKGVVRVYKADKSGAKQFIGEDRIEHTPRDEEVRVKMGEAFDVVGDRKQTNYSRISSCLVETEWEVELRNHKDKSERVEVWEPVGGDWEILDSSHKAKKEDSKTFYFDVEVPSRGKTKITYRLRVRWC